MNFKLTIRFASVLCVAATSITANAQLQLVCPLDWSALANIEGTNSDRVIYGVKARDWKKEYLDEMLSKEEECLRNSSDPDSVKEATLNAVRTRSYPNGVRAIEERDQRQQQTVQSEKAQQLAQERQRQSDEAKRHQDEVQRQTESQRRQDERDKSNNLLIFLAVITASVGGWIWNKIVRNHCPKCKSTSIDRVRETPINRWRGTKQISEKNSRGTKTRHVPTTFVTMQFEYCCKNCQHEWSKIRKKEELGTSSINRFFSGY